MTQSHRNARESESRIGATEGRKGVHGIAIHSAGFQCIYWLVSDCLLCTPWVWQQGRNRAYLQVLENSTELERAFRARERGRGECGLI